MEEPRFYVTDIDSSHPAHMIFPDWYGVVDEMEGGIIAVFKQEYHANLFVLRLAF